MTLPMYDPGSGFPMYGDSMLPLACDEEVCCPEQGCDCEEGGLQADFNWSNTAGDPCTFNFEDISVPGTCGDIVMWEWFRTGMEEPFSTAQNPSLFFPGCGPWNVRLRVTDEEGCIDEVTETVDCCCCANDGPTANFSYEQTDTDPCTYSLNNETSPGSCGDVTYEWLCNDVVFSTDENPADFQPGEVCEGDGPWDIVLRVTDSFGCFDEVVGEISCASPGDCMPDCDEVDSVCGSGVPGQAECLCIGGTQPDQIRVTFAGMDGLCSFLNGVYVLDRFGSCGYSYLFEDPPLRRFTDSVQVFLGCKFVEVRLTQDVVVGGPDIAVAWRRHGFLGGSPNPINDNTDMGVFFNNCSTLSVTLGDGDEILTDSDCFLQSGVTILVEAI